MADPGRLLPVGLCVSPFVYRIEGGTDARVLGEDMFGPHVVIIPFRPIQEGVLMQ